MSRHKTEQEGWKVVLAGHIFCLGMPSAAAPHQKLAWRALESEKINRRQANGRCGPLVLWSFGPFGSRCRRGPISEGGRRWAGAATIRISRELSETFWGHGEER